MSTFASTLSRRTSRWLFWLAAALLTAGVVALLVALFGHTTKSSSTGSRTPAKAVTNEKSVPLPEAVRKVVARFIVSAVQRRNLAEAWNLSGPGIRAGLTRKQFLSGNIPVVPISGKITGSAYKVDFSYPRQVQLQAVLAVRGEANGIGRLYIVELRRYGHGPRAHWLVESWVPWRPIPVPASGGG